MPLTSVKKGEKGKRETVETPSIQSLDRGLLILEAVGKSPEPVSLGQLAAMLGIDRSSAFRLAKTLSLVLLGEIWAELSGRKSEAKGQNQGATFSDL